jgi:hypothetical protein
MRERRWIPVALAVALVVAVLAYLALGGGERGRSGSRSAPARGPEPEAARAAPLADADLAAPAEPAAAESERAPLYPSTPAAAPDTAGAHARLVLVVEAASGRPVAGAEVFALDRVDGDFDWEPLFFESLVEKVAPLRSDANGRVAIPFVGAAPRLVLARAPGWLGGEHIAPTGPGGAADGAPARLALHPDWDVAIEVALADGRPAVGVSLGLDLGDTTFSDLTDADGRASFEHVGFACATRDARAEVAVQVPLEPRLAAVLEGEPREPVRFRLPPLASVEVTVLDPQRVPVPDGTMLQLGLVRPTESRDLSPFARSARQRIVGATNDGHALFAFVEPGLELELLVRTPGAVAERKAYFPGPARAGERLEHTLVLALDQPVLEFRVLEAPGRPLADAELGLRLSVRSRYMRNEHQPAARTDSEGRFRLELPAEFRAGERRMLRITAREESLGARVDLAGAFEPGLRSMGDVMLEPVPLVVAGRVSDGEGKGVAGAALELEGAVTEDEEGERFWYWEDLPLRVVSGADGAFAARGLIEARRLRLSARAGAQRSARVEAKVGAEAVELVVRTGGTLAGSLLLDPAVPVGQLVLALQPESADPRVGARDSDAEQHDQVRPDGSFTLEDVVPGSYRFEVRTSSNRSLAEIAGVVVAGGEETRDPRLQGLDLRASIFARRITLVFPAPVTEVNGNLQHHPTGNEHDERYHWFDENPFVVLTELPSFDGVLVVLGYRSVRLEGVSGDREVALQPALRVRLVLPAEVVLPTPPTYVKAALAPLDEENQIDWGAEVFDERRESRCLASGPGTLKVVWLLEQRSAGGAMATTIELTPEQRVEVLDVGYEQRFELTVDPAALAAALAKER